VRRSLLEVAENFADVIWISFLCKR
jgi:hypothetical protein